MKILLVINDFHNPSNGLCVSTQRFAKQFSQMGHEVRILSGTQYGAVDYPLAKKKIFLFQPLIEKYGYNFAKPDKAVIRQAVEWADVVHLEEPFPLQHVCAKIARALGKPITGTFHLYPENMLAAVHMAKWKLINWWLLLIFRDYVYDYCDYLQCPTDKVKERLQSAHYGAQMEVISNGITPEHFVERTAKPEEIKDKFIVLNIGRFAVEKDQKTLINAVALSKNRNKILLILAGRGPLEKQYVQLCEKLHLNYMLSFATQQELINVTRYSDVIVHCADVEVEGMSVMEAFAAGAVPIIARAPLTSTSHFRLSDKNVFAAHDSHTLAFKIDSLYDDPQLLADLSMKYQEYAKDFTLERSAQKVLAMMMLA